MNHTVHIAHRWPVNITPTERIARILIGATAMIAAVVFLTSAGSALAIALAVLLFAAGADLLVTGALGHCPLYQKLGYTPAKLRGRS
jgi:hypothetical protein